MDRSQQIGAMSSSVNDALTSCILRQCEHLKSYLGIDVHQAHRLIAEWAFKVCFLAFANWLVDMNVSLARLIDALELIAWHYPAFRRRDMVSLS